ASLKTAAVNGGPDDGSNYYDVWLETLEALLTETDMVSGEALLDMKSAWTAAYLDTPHGEPVMLTRDGV
ncbi:MAG: nitrile hydratase accessory protein, partial [Hyphomicrobiaceae bacterium]